MACIPNSNHTINLADINDTKGHEFKKNILLTYFDGTKKCIEISNKGISSLNVATTLRDKGHISNDIVLLVDEMYLQKENQYHGGRYVGADENGEFYSGILVMMAVGLKQSVPVVVQAEKFC